MSPKWNHDVLFAVWLSAAVYCTSLTSILSMTGVKIKTKSNCSEIIFFSNTVFRYSVLSLVNYIYLFCSFLMLLKAVGGFWLTAASDCTHRMLPFRQSEEALISRAIFFLCQWFHISHSGVPVTVPTRNDRFSKGEEWSYYSYRLHLGKRQDVSEPLCHWHVDSICVVTLAA